jgi:hypothetical protein
LRLRKTRCTQANEQDDHQRGEEVAHRICPLDSYAELPSLSALKWRSAFCQRITSIKQST